MRQASMVRRSSMAKKEAAIAASAIFLAKNNNDPLYRKLKKYRDLWQETKSEVLGPKGPSFLLAPSNPGS